METLADWIRQKGPLTPPEAAGWAIRLAKHVESLHEHGVAHGNVSPACVLMGSSDPKTPGFMSDVRKTTESVPYHSPERVRGGQLSPADDAWAIAATLYTALTAAPPFVGANDAELKQQVLKGAPAPLAVYGVEDDGLDRLLSAAFNPDSTQRLTNVTQLRQELERWHPDAGSLLSLEDEEPGDEDQAATQMLPMMMDDEIGGTDAALQRLFAPPSFQPDSRPGASRASAPQPPAEPPPPAEQDATVMRALPAHIMAMAARAASGSSPPPPEPGVQAPVMPPPDRAPTFQGGPPASRPEPFGGVPRPGPGPQAPEPPVNHAAMRPALPPLTPPEPEGDTTRIAPAPDLAAAFRSAQLREAEAAHGPVSPPRPGVPRPGFGAPGARPPTPGPAFAPPAFEAPRPTDPDDVRTVMHANDLPNARPQDVRAQGASDRSFAGGAFAPAEPPRLMPQPPPGLSAQVAPGPSASRPEIEDEDDGARTVMRDPPMLGEMGWPPQTSQAQAQFDARWQPAAPPTNAQGPLSSQPAFARAPGPPNQTPFPSPANQGPQQQLSGISGMHGAVQQGGPHPSLLQHQQSGLQHGGLGGPPPLVGQGPGVSALIQEALEQGPSLHADPNPSPPQGHLSSALAGGMNHGASPSPLLGGSLPGMTPPGAFPPPPGGYAPALAAQGMLSNSLPTDLSPTGYPLGASLSEAAPRKKSSIGLIIVCLLVLVLAAAVTFLALKYRAKLGIPLHF